MNFLSILPIELLDNVIDHLPEPIAPYSTIDRLFKSLIERRTFSAPRITCTPSSLANFESAITRHNRFSLVGQIQLDISLPEISVSRFKKFRGRKEAAASSRVVVEAISSFCQVLGRCETLGYWHRDLVVNVVPSCVRRSEYSDEGPENSHGLGTNAITRHENPAWENRTAHSYILFPEGTVFPPVYSITGLDTRGSLDYIHPRSVAVLAKAMPNISRIEVEVPTVPLRYRAERSLSRSLVASAVRTLASFSYLDRVTIWAQSESPANERLDLQSVIDTKKKDLISCAIAHLSRLPFLRILQLTNRHTLSSEIFPHTDGDLWPALQILEIGMNCITPDGHWYFEGDLASAPPTDEYDGLKFWESESEDERNPRLDSDDSLMSDWEPRQFQTENGERPSISFRHDLDSNTFTNFFLTLVQSANRMKSLRHLRCSFPDKYPEALDIFYTSNLRALLASDDFGKDKAMNKLDRIQADLEQYEINHDRGAILTNSTAGRWIIILKPEDTETIIDLPTWHIPDEALASIRLAKQRVFIYQ